VWVPVIVVGKGAGCAQSYVDPTGATRVYIRDQLALGTNPVQILSGLAGFDTGHQTRQYGIADVLGRAVGFTGTQAGAFASDRVGRIGDVLYAIQGNVLTGGPVLAAAELALYATPGDLGEKMMAAMEAARLFGGDGRCSCNKGAPTSCGSPPPTFTTTPTASATPRSGAPAAPTTCGSTSPTAPAPTPTRCTCCAPSTTSGACSSAAAPTTSSRRSRSRPPPCR
jgi:hypothetical protein